MASGISTHVWESVELVFKSTRTYKNPFRDVQLSAECSGPNGEHLVVPGFWDGGNVWKVRFVAKSIGQWQWRSLCSHPLDRGLHGKTGTIAAAPWAESQISENPNRRGFIKIHESGRYFVYDDGTPFYWMGDTLWSAHTKRFDVKNALPMYIKDRKAKGFSVVQMCVGHAAGGLKDEDSPCYNRGGPEIYTNEGGAPYRRRYDLINPGYFQAFDKRLKGFIDAGMVPCLMAIWCWDLKGLGVEHLKEYWRYLIARYASYNVVWSVTGEYHFYPKAEEFRQVGWEIHRYDPYEHPTSAHANAPHSGSIHYQQDEWYDFSLAQVGHVLGFRQMLEQIPLADYHAHPVKPSIMSESWYENHPNCVLEQGRIMDKDIRFATYVPLLMGAIGQSYGAHGIWTWYEGDSPDKWSDFDKPARWRQDLKLPGSKQMKYVRTVFESVRWWELEPHPEWVTTPEGTHCYCAASYGKEYVCYVAGGKCQLMVFVPGGNENAQYEGTWFDPRTGKWVKPQKVHYHGYGNWMMWRAPTPDTQDWVLVLKRQ